MFPYENLIGVYIIYFVCRYWPNTIALYVGIGSLEYQMVYAYAMDSTDWLSSYNTLIKPIYPFNVFNGVRSTFAFCILIV